MRPARRADAHALGGDTVLASGLTLTQTILTSIAGSVPSAYAIDDEEGPWAVWGVIPCPSAGRRAGLPWLVLAARGRARRRAIVALSREWIENFHVLFPDLVFTVDADAPQNVDYAEWAGAVKQRADQYPGKPIRFQMLLSRD